ncbi:hypothetical protein AAC387_Pa09g2377 [Persea americana]
MGVLVARTGRELQRYTATGGREVVGCIPYRMKGGMKQEDDDDRPCTNNCLDEEMEVLLITSQKGGDAIMFPKGGWEKDETKEKAACREAEEEAGVLGTLEDILGNWSFKSKRYDAMYEGHVFPLKVTKELDRWAEDKVRQRRWVTVAEAREICQQWWMKAALERLVTRLSNTKRQIAYVEEGTEKLVEQKNWSCMKEAQKILVTRLSNTKRQIASMKEGTEKMVEQRNWWMKTALEIIVDHLSNTIRQIVSVKEGKHWRDWWITSPTPSGRSRL